MSATPVQTEQPVGAEQAATPVPEAAAKSVAGEERQTEDKTEETVGGYVFPKIKWVIDDDAKTDETKTEIKCVIDDDAKTETDLERRQRAADKEAAAERKKELIRRLNTEAERQTRKTSWRSQIKKHDPDWSKKEDNNVYSRQLSWNPLGEETESPSKAPENKGYNPYGVKSEYQSELTARFLGIKKVGKVLKKHEPKELERYKFSGKLVDRRRMAAIPLAGQPVEKDPELPQPASYTLPILGGVSAALVCIGCVIKRKFNQEKNTLARLESVRVDK